MGIVESDLQWLAGIIDSEGSIELRYSKCKRKGYSIAVRVARMRIKMCDRLAVPRVARIIDRGYQNNEYAQSVCVIGGSLRRLLPQLIPYLYTKQPQAKLVLQALDIKAGEATTYLTEESLVWDSLFKKVAVLNKRGLAAEIDTYQRTHTFSWPWLAGFVDGDGTIMLGKFGRIIKPILKISLAHLPTISYLAEKLGRGELSSGGGKGNKRSIRAIRLMSNDLLQVLPEIIPYLVVKKKHAELALEIVRLRAAVPNGQHNHPNILAAKELVNSLAALNAISKKSRRQ